MARARAQAPVRELVLNGKFLAAAPTGVHRVAAELTAALAGLIAEQHPATAALRLRGLAPVDGIAAARALPLPVRPLGPLRGVPWEQFVLPLRKGRGTLLNLCNIGPVLSRNAVTMIHDAQVLLTPESYRPAFRCWYRLVQPLIAARHRHLLTVSHYSREQILRAGLCPPERISVVHNGGDHVLRAAADPGVIGRLNLAPQGYVAALASPLAHKNVAVLLRAFRRPELAGLTLVLFGPGGREDFQRRGLAVPPNVVFAGRLSEGELRHLLEHAVALAFPSLTEGFGLPPLEAMQLGCPVVAAPCGAIPEVCGEAVSYADPHDPSAWASRIAELRDDPQLRAARAAAGLHRAAQFTWRRAAERLAEVLATV